MTHNLQALETMAIPSSSSSLKKYDVFISFRGDDTRAAFTSHLHASLSRSYLETYIDYRIQKGNNVWEELVKAIKQSTLFLVVFSDDYASSTWCLNELVEIMECHQNEPDKVVVIPVFYRIEPSQVRKQTGSYATAFANHKKQHKKDKIQKWKDILSQAANLSGFHYTAFGTESDLIKEVTRFVLGKLDHKFKNELPSNFIPNENYWRIEFSLKTDSSEVQIIGLWGMGGIGKTTLAEAIFHKFSFQYEGSCILKNVTEESKRHGINYICNKLLSKLLREDLHIDSPKVISSAIMRRLKRMKAFIVLDDVRTIELLQNLIGVGHGWLGAGSTIIVTTRDKHVLISGGVSQIHQVKQMNYQNSLQLFSLNAFAKVLPEEGYMDLSKRAIEYAKGNPLALKFLGSFLRCKSQIEWNCALAKLKEFPNKEIDLILRWSYDELDDTEKDIFLDIAFCFNGDKRDMITKILNKCGLYAEIGIRNLLDKALIVDLNECIQMHDLIREMGKQVVREESPKNPGQRSRLCDPKEVCDVLKNDRGTEMVKVIFLDATECTDLNLSSKVFENMPNLRLLIFRDHKGIKSIRFPSGLDLLPENLRCFLWDGYPCKSLPPTYSFEMLVEFSMRDSHVEKLWNGEQNLPNLEILDLSNSKKLIECPNLSGSPNLKYVTLSGCERLPEVDSSIFLLPKLETLLVRECKSLKTLSSNTCSPALIEFDARDCINLQEFSVQFAAVDHLDLTLPKFGTNGLPSSILHFKNLERFRYPISDSLVNLPENFAHCIWLVFKNIPKGEPDTSTTLRKVLPSPAFLSVKELIIDRNHMLFEIPDNISLLSSLECLSLIGIAIRSLPESIKYLPRLVYLEVIDCYMLQSIPALSQFIPYFFVWDFRGSLEKVLSSMSEPSDKPNHGFMFLNCTELDSHSYQTVINDAIAGIELGARQNSKNEDPSLDHDNDIIMYFLPAMSGMENWSHYPSAQASVTLELPPNLLGFAYYLVLSQGNVGYGVDFGCECCLDNSSGERIYIKSFERANCSSVFFSYVNPTMYMRSDHLVLWYDPAKCKQIMKAVEEIKAINDVNITRYNPKLTFRFFIDESLYDEVTIVECGFHWIYPFEGSAVPNRNDDREDTVPPTNNLKQSVVGTLSSLEVDESEDSSYSLEQLLNSMERSWSGEKKIPTDLKRHNK